jgi:hypothetical protein
MRIQIVPKGKDRSMTKTEYIFLNTLFKKIEYENREKVQHAIMNLLLYGESYIKI